MYIRPYPLLAAGLFSACVTFTDFAAETNGTSSFSACGVDARMLRYPDVSSTQIAFVYAGDIWVASKSGGEAQRLSSPKGEESDRKSVV